MTLFQFQTPEYVADYMVSLIKYEPKLVLEPSIGEGNLIKSLWKKYPQCKVIAYDILDCPIKDERLEFHKGNFLDADTSWIKPDLILSNPPFTPMTLSYGFFDVCIQLCRRGVYLLPYLFLNNSNSRPRTYSEVCDILNVINLPRTIFKNSRIQSCILDVTYKVDRRGYPNYIWYEPYFDKSTWK